MDSLGLQAKPLQLNTADAGFEVAFAARLHWSADTDAAIEQRVADILARDLVLQLGGEDGQAIQEDAHIERLLVRFRELHLPLEVQEVLLI